MNESQARELEGELSETRPGRKVTVTPDDDGGGAQIVIESTGEAATYEIGDGPSRLLSCLLTGRAG